MAGPFAGTQDQPTAPATRARGDARRRADARVAWELRRRGRADPEHKQVEDMMAGTMTDPMVAAPGQAVPAGVLEDAAAMTAAYLRLTDGTETALIARLCAVAIGCAEAFLGAGVIARGFEDVVAADGAWHRLAAAPVGSIAGVTALPAAAAPFVLPVDDYRIDIAPDGSGWVRVTGGAPLAAVSYVAGMATGWADVPAPVAQGVVAMAARLFADRDAAVAPAPDVAALWRPYRRLRLGLEPELGRPEDGR